MRKLEEWIGKHDDQKVPPHVRLRIFEREHGVCQWEYHTVSLAYSGLDMNKLGREGWELVAVCIMDSSSYRPTAFFKRPIKSDKAAIGT